MSNPYFDEADTSNEDKAWTTEPVTPRRPRRPHSGATSEGGTTPAPPVTPEPTPEPEPAPPVTPEPEPAPTPAPPVTPEPEPAPTPAPPVTPEPTPEPEPAPPVTPEPTPEPEPAPPVTPEFQEEDSSVSEKGSTGKGLAAKFATFTRPKKKSGSSAGMNAFRGGRWKIIALRALVWSVLGMLLLGGLRQLFFPSPFNYSKVTDELVESYGLSTFPVSGGAAVAQAFTQEYLTVDQASVVEREEVLSQYVADDVPSDAEWLQLNAEAVNQEVIAGPSLVARPEVIGDCELPDVDAAPCRAVYTYAVQVAAPGKVRSEGLDAARWVYLAVPVVADGSGVSVADAPAFRPGGGQAVTGAPEEIVRDPSIEDQVAEQLPAFFQAWAIGGEDQMRLVVTSDASPDALRGLGGTVTFLTESGVTDVAVVAVDENADPGLDRTAYVTVEWQDTASGVVFQQNYKLTISLAEDDRNWLVSEIEAGTFGNSEVSED
jgi:hypothetical protein